LRELKNTLADRESAIEMLKSSSSVAKSMIEPPTHMIDQSQSDMTIVFEETKVENVQQQWSDIDF